MPLIFCNSHNAPRLCIAIFEPSLSNNGKVQDEEESMWIEEDKEKDGLVTNGTKGDEKGASKGG